MFKKKWKMPGFDMCTDIVFQISQELHKTFKIEGTFLKLHQLYSSANNQAHSMKFSRIGARQKIFSGSKADFFVIVNIFIKYRLTS